MKNTSTYYLIAVLLCAALISKLQAQTTAFTYQGQLTESGTPVTGSYDLGFELFDSATFGSSMGVVTNTATPVSDGLFTVQLDFGSGVFDGSDLWLEIGAVTNGGGAFTTLSPRQPITSAPYALYAPSAGTAIAVSGSIPASQLTGTILPANIGAGTIDATMLANDSVGTNQLADGTALAEVADDDGAGSGLDADLLDGLQGTAYRNAGNLNTGTLGTSRYSAYSDLSAENRLDNNNGSDLLMRSQADGRYVLFASSHYWKTSGNAGTSPGIHFIGTTDNQPFDIRVNNQRVFRLESPSIGSVNITGGYSGNSIATGTEAAIIAGGGSLTIPNSIGMGSSYSTIGGGGINTIEGSVPGATIAGGYHNVIGSQSGNSTVGGGFDNNIESNSWYATISGGHFNDIGVDSDYSIVGGGNDNNIGSNSRSATISGGTLNDIGVDSDYSTVGGGYDCDVGDGAQYAYAAGRRAKANHSGTFVWADSTNVNFASTGNDQFLIRASGGVGIGTASPAAQLHVRTPTGVDSDIRLVSGGSWSLILNQDPTSVFSIQNGGAKRFYILSSGRVGIGIAAPTEKLHVSGNILATGTVTGLSDRNMKENFSGVNAQDILAHVVSMPIQRWNYIGEDVIHMGPVAQDFYSAFGVGMDEKHISMVDADGVAFAAIQGLNQKLEAKVAEIARLKARLDRLETLLETQTAGDQK